MSGSAANTPKITDRCILRIRPTALIALGAGFFVADRIFKSAALILPGSLGWPGLAEFSLFRNSGIAFSLPLPPNLFWPLALPALLLVLLLLYRTALNREFFATAALFLVAAGAISNLTDHLLYEATIDYVIFFGISAVNIADLLIVAGAAMLFVFWKRQRPETAA